MTPERDAEPIEDYLDELLSCLRLPPRATRRLLAETEDHLRQSAEDAVHQGMSRPDAERAAVRAFGPAARVAAAAGTGRRADVATLVRLSAWSLLALGGVALVAIGLSGALAAVFKATAGPRFVGGLPQTYSNGVCRYFLTLHPSVGTCSAAATLENSQDAVSLRLLAGVCGGVLVGVAASTRRYLRADLSLRRMFDAMSAVIATIAFAVAALWLNATAADVAVRDGGSGAGWYLSAGLVSAGATVAAAIIARRALRTLRPWVHVTVTD